MSRAEPNILSELDLSTYKLTMYLVKPSLFDDPSPLVNDDAYIGKSAIVIAETGVTGSFSIDNMVMRSVISPSDKYGYTTTSIIQFDLLEPLGFSLLDKLQALSDAYKFNIIQEARFVLKIEFLGRDPITGAGETLPGVYLYTIYWNDVRATLDEGGARYTIGAFNQLRSGLINATTEQNINWVSKEGTVEDYIKSFVKSINKHEMNLRGSSEGSATTPKKHYKYKIKQVDDPDANAMITKLMNMKMVGGETYSAAAHNAPDGETDTDVNGGLYQLERNSSIINTLRQDISMSTPEYAKATIQTNETENKHYSLRIDIENKVKEGKDQALNRRENELTINFYMENTYSTPIADPKKHQDLLTNVTKQGEYFELLKDNSLCKKYDYLYTGQNAEVLDFTLEYNGLFYLPLNPNDAMNYPASMGAYGSVTSAKEPSIDNARFLSEVEEGKTMAFKPSYEYVAKGNDSQRSAGNSEDRETFIASFYHNYPQRSADFINSEITIKGDPFWLGTPDVLTSGSAPSMRSFSGNEIQVAIVVVRPDPSLADIENRELNGIEHSSTGIYKVLSVEHKFQQGKFVQTLELLKNIKVNPYIVANRIAEL